jgi:glycosyltransferase-like protein
MIMNHSLRIAFLTYSTKARGSVMQTLYLAEALQAMGHHVCIFALSKDSEFCRPVSCTTRLIPSQPAPDPANIAAVVQQRIQEFVDYFEQSLETYDCYHSQDCISANALAILRDRHRIPHFIRTVHHIESFQNSYLQQCQDRSIVLPDRCLCVSQHWQSEIFRHYQVETTRVINGVDSQRFHPSSNSSQQIQPLKQRLHIKGNPIYLTVGGIEPRKNSIALLQAFAQVLKIYPQAQLVIAGGDTFFDYSFYRQQFFEIVQQLGISDDSLVLPGVITDADLPILYSCADAFVFPSVKEGWGLVVMEAIAAQVPILTSNIPPFTEFLDAPQALLVDPESIAAIAQGMIQILQPDVARSLVQQSQSVLAQYTWARAAQMHLECYRSFSHS